MKKNKELKKMFYYRNYNKKIIKLILLIIVGLIFAVTVFPYITKQMLDVQIPKANIYGVLGWGVIYIINIVISCYIVLKYCIIRLDLRRLIENDLREDIFKKLQEIEISFYDKNTTGTVLQFLSNDADNASNLFPRILVEILVMGILRMLVTSILLLFVNFEIGFGILLIYIIGFSTTFIMNRKTVSMIKNIRDINVAVFNAMNEGIDGFTTIKNLSIEKEQIEKLEKGIEKYNVVQNKLNKIITKYNMIFQLFSVLTTVWLIYKGTINLQTGIITYGLLTIIIGWTDSIKSDSRFILRHLTDFNRAYIAFLKILEFLEEKNIEDLESGEELKDIENIEFRNVKFSYQKKEKVINNFNLTVNSKEKVALVGKTGSGKSTIVNLVCRFYEPISGKILINSKDIKSYKLRELRSKIGYVMQDVTIFKYTIIDNIRYVNPNITIEEIQEIFKKLNLHDKIMTLKDNYETNIYDYPDILSKGEKQLISFARIMAMNPEIIILDEITSSLSYSSEMLLKNAMEQITKDKICFIIAHRLSTISTCDQILVMGNGKVLEQGNHEELLLKKRRIL